MLGGTPRTFRGIFNNPSGKAAQDAASLFEKGWVKEVPLDSTFAMSDAIQVSGKLPCSQHILSLLTRPSRLLKSKHRIELLERSS
ncbi:hypothetical protein GGR56DRAFT_558181 [Xylariaceae sp. FL0804]|nr:hypothetical protein GGR56DRAFT_558181 [Xylariaceae sp. FL0804]